MCSAALVAGRRSRAALLLVVVFLAACSGEFEPSDLKLDSPQAVRIKTMIADLRSAGMDGMESVLARDGATDQLTMLKFALAPLVQADEAQLRDLTRYGPDVYAACITLTTSGKTTILDMLLVETDNTILWAGRQ